MSGRDLAGSDDIGARASRARIATLEHALRGLPLPFAVESIKKLMARHGDRASAGLCRHDEARGMHTLSCAVFDCRTPALLFSYGPPCEGRWTRLSP